MRFEATCVLEKRAHTKLHVYFEQSFHHFASALGVIKKCDAIREPDVCGLRCCDKERISQTFTQTAICADSWQPDGHRGPEPRDAAWDEHVLVPGGRPVGPKEGDAMQYPGRGPSITGRGRGARRARWCYPHCGKGSWIWTNSKEENNTVIQLNLFCFCFEKALGVGHNSGGAQQLTEPAEHGESWRGRVGE